MNIEQIELELTWAADEFLLEEFDLELDIPIRISKRMTKTFGAFHCNRKEKRSIEITISANLIENHSWDTVIDTLKHEAVHYALFELGKPYKDGDKYFKDTLAIHGISRTRTFKFRGTVHVYECIECGTKYEKHVKGFEKNYGCGECIGLLKYNGTAQV